MLSVRPLFEDPRKYSRARLSSELKEHGLHTSVEKKENG